MIVLDASVVVELLINGPSADSVRHHLSAHDEAFIAPHLLDIEVMSAIRNMSAGRRIDPHRSEQFLMGLRRAACGRFRTRRSSAAFGSCGTTSLPTTPLTSP